MLLIVGSVGASIVMPSFTKGKQQKAGALGGPSSRPFHQLLFASSTC